MQGRKAKGNVGPAIGRKVLKSASFPYTHLLLVETLILNEALASFTVPL